MQYECFKSIPFNINRLFTRFKFFYGNVIGIFENIFTSHFSNSSVIDNKDHALLKIIGPFRCVRLNNEIVIKRQVGKRPLELSVPTPHQFLCFFSVVVKDHDPNIRSCLSGRLVERDPVFRNGGVRADTYKQRKQEEQSHAAKALGVSITARIKKTLETQKHQRACPIYLRLSNSTNALSNSSIR